MPGFTERLFRLTLLYAGLIFLITGLWGIVSAWFAWHAVTSLDRSYDPIYYLITFIILYAPRPLLGILLLFRFRHFARKMLSKLHASPERSQPVWHDTPVFAALLSLITGLYFLYIGLAALPQTWLSPLIEIARFGSNLTMITTIFQREGLRILTPVCFVICGLVLCCYADKISAKVARMVETTPDAESEDQIMNDDEVDEAKKEGS